jgi:hypothetical protein
MASISSCNSFVAVIICCILSSTAAYFFLPAVMWADIPASAAAIDPQMAAALPPPGMGLVELRSCTKASMDCFANSVSMGFSPFTVTPRSCGFIYSL